MRNIFGAIGLVGILVGALGCGGEEPNDFSDIETVDFVGTYTGILKEERTCQTANPGPFILMDSDYSVTIIADGNGWVWENPDCGEIQLRESGLSLSPKLSTCPPTTIAGVKTTLTYKPSGTLELDGNALKLALDTDLLVEMDGKAHTCTSRLTGALVKSF